MVNASLQLQFDRVRSADGFFAALDQSGGSTPEALEHYGISRNSYSTDDDMFRLMQEMRERVILSPAFSGSHIVGAILFERTVQSVIDGQRTPEFLWRSRNIVPFLKVDEGLEKEAEGVQLMKPLTRLESLLQLARDHEILGTKMRSLILQPSLTGISRVVDQQFEYAHAISDAGLLPILEPEVSTKLWDKERATAEEMLMRNMREHLDALPSDRDVMLKLTIPVIDGFYRELAGHPRVVRILALSGGFSRADANGRLARNAPMIASFSRALLQDLRASMTGAQFDAALSSAISSIYSASTRTTLQPSA